MNKDCRRLLRRGVKYAIDALKWGGITEPGSVTVCVPFYMEFERGVPATAETERRGVADPED